MGKRQRVVRTAKLHPPKMLRDVRVAGLASQRRSKAEPLESPEWAGRVSDMSCTLPVALDG